MLTLQGVSYAHPNGDTLFSDLSINISRQDKIALTGNNGAGKSTLLQILAGLVQPTAGRVSASYRPFYVPQLLGQYDGCSIAAALHVEEKLNALHSILAGNVTDANLSALADDWSIEERCAEALQYWNLGNISLTRNMNTLSGGQKTSVLLAGIMIHQPAIVLLDEPSNHLDMYARDILYEYIRQCKSTLVVVSHDRKLLNLIDTVYELDKRGVTVYGGNYDFYTAQKALERDALQHDMHSVEKALRKAKETERHAMERQQKLDARGRGKQEKAGLPTISMNTLRNNAEKSTARMKDVHAEKVTALAHELDQLRKEMPDRDGMRMNLDHSTLHKGKILVAARTANYQCRNRPLWREPLDLEIRSGERISLAGANGSGKTTLIRMMLGELPPASGTIERAEMKVIYIDQEYSLVAGSQTVYEQVQRFNAGALQEHELKNRLNRFLFTKDDRDKPCNVLSGGEKMRLMLCCLTIGNQAPDMIILDEPTNNLDISNVAILTTAINDYRGALLVVSHDGYFLEQIGIGRTISLE